MPTRPTSALLLLCLILVVPGCAAAPALRDDQCRIGIADVYERVSPSSVSITAVAINPGRSAERFERGEGSGFIVDADDSVALIATNAHVVEEAQALLVGLHDGRQVPAELVGFDPVFDLALLRISVPGGATLRGVEFGESATLRPGDTVIAIGSPLGLAYSVTAGIVSAIDRVLPTIPFTLSEPYIQVDTPINPGNSGGPLLDACGRVVGMNTAIVGGANSIGFAIPSDLITSVLPMLVEHGLVLRPWIGFHGQFIGRPLVNLLALPLTPGFLVEMVEPGSPPEAAGLAGGQLAMSLNGREYLLGGDVIVAFNGVAATDPARMLEAVRSVGVDGEIRLTVQRAGQRVEIRYRAGPRPILPSDLAGMGRASLVTHRR